MSSASNDRDRPRGAGAAAQEDFESGSPGPLADLSVSVGGLRLRNPILAASGTFGMGEVGRPFFAPSHLGGIVLKTVTPALRKGNPPPRTAEVTGGLLNSIGLQNPGIEGFKKQYGETYPEFDTCIVASVAGAQPEDYARLASEIGEVSGITAVELNLSCPNVSRTGMDFAKHPETVAPLVARAKESTGLPIWAKLTPEANDVVAVAQAAEEGGADAVTLINTVPGLVLDWKRRRPILGAGFGGLSGPAIKPVALRLVALVRRSCSIPIVGVGGIRTATDVLEFLVAGASAVQVGTANFLDPEAMIRILKELHRLLNEEGVGDVESLIGSLTIPEPTPWGES